MGIAMATNKAKLAYVTPKLVYPFVHAPNTLNDIIIRNLKKIYNIICACFSIQEYIFQTKLTFYF